MSNIKSRLTRLKNRKPSDALQVAAVKTSFLGGALSFPKVIEPVNRMLNLESWIAENFQAFQNDLLKYGAILFRGFKINTVERFQKLMTSFPSESLEYTFRSSPRYALADNVYVSTTYPPDQHIVMHSESSYAPNHPARIVFCCITPAEVQGETPIADNRKIYQQLSDSLRDKFHQKGVLYRRNLTETMGLSWKEVFQLDDKEAVAVACRKNGMNYHWKNENDLMLDWTKKAIWQHPKSGETIWFNHALFFNKYMQGEEILDVVQSDEDLPNNTLFGDGTAISKAEIEEIQQAYEQSTVVFPWQRGDVLFLDNMLMSHGRNPYRGARKIIVSMS